VLLLDEHIIGVKVSERVFSKRLNIKRRYLQEPYTEFKVNWRE